MKHCSRHKNMKDVGGSKTGQLVNEAAVADTSEFYVSDCSEVSHADI